MAEKRKVWRVKDSAGNLEQVLVETSAEQVTLTPKDGVISATNVQTAIEEIANLAATGGVTSVNGRQGAVVLDKGDVGLGNVDNTADADKPVSTAQQAALDKKVDKTTTVNGHALSGNVTVTKGDVGLGNVDNTADSEKNVATAVKATKDGSGNIIVDTYATKTDLQNGLAGKSSTKTYDTYSAFVTAVMAMNNTALKVGDNVLIKALDVPDMWVYKVNTTKTDYTYSSDANIIAALATANGLTVGYYVFAKLETQKVDLTSYQTKTDNSLATTDKTIVGAINELDGDVSSLTTRIGDVESKNTSQDTAIGNAQTTADQAKSASATNAGAIEDIVDGTTTVKKAESATSATTATKLSASKTVALTGNVTGSTTTDLSGNVSIATTIADGAVATSKIANNAVTTEKLSNSGVVAGTYSVVTVDAKGRATKGGIAMEFGTTGQTTPSANLMVGGLFFELQ